jgi:HK97 family phage major capsid protein
MNRNEVIELRQKRAALAEQARTILNEAKDGVLTAEQRQKFDAIHTDIEALGGRIQAEERQHDLEISLENSVREPHKPEVRDQKQGRTVDREEYNAEFRNWIVGGLEAVKPENRSMFTEVRAQSVASNGGGGYTVPTGFRATLMEAMKAFGGVRTSGATIITTDAGNSLPIPTVDETSQTGELVAENTAVTAQDATFSSVTLGAYKFSSKSILVSFELLSDSAIDVEAFVANALATRLARALNTYGTTGTGSSQPQGVVTAATAGKTAASATAITYLELIDLIHAVDPAHRPNAKFMFKDGVLKALKQLQDSQGRPLWLPGVAVKEPDTIVGYPYVINQDMAAMTTGQKTVLFGDFKYFHIRDVWAVELYRIVDKYIEQGSVGFLAYYRGDQKMVNPGSNPLKYLIQA